MAAYQWSAALRSATMAVAVGCVWMLLAGVAGWCMLRARRRSSTREGWRVPLAELATALAAAGFGALLGVPAGLQQVSNLHAYLGQPATIVATVVSAHAVQGGMVADIEIVRLVPDAAGLPGLPGVRARATWLLWGRAGSRAPLTAGDSVTSSGTLGVPPQLDGKGQPLRAQLASFGIDYEWSGRLLQSTSQHTFFGTRRTFITNAMAAADPARRGVQPLLNSIVFGGATPSQATNQQFLAAGLLHVLAASGANILLFVHALDRGVRPVWRLARLPAWTWSGLVIAAVWMFAGLCGDAPSIVRAAIMATYRELGRAVGRHPGTLDATLVAFLAMSWVDPAVLPTVSSVLSFAATVAVAAAVRARPGFRTRLSTAAGWLMPALRHVLQSLRVTLFVEAAMLPLTLAYFGQITPYSVLSNLIAEPVLAVLLPCACLYMAAGCAAQIAKVLARPACQDLGWLTNVLLQVLQRWVDTVAGWHDALIQVPNWPAAWVIGYFVTLIAMIWLWSHRRHTILCYNQFVDFVTNFTNFRKKQAGAGALDVSASHSVHVRTRRHRRGR